MGVGLYLYKSYFLSALSIQLVYGGTKAEMGVLPHIGRIIGSVYMKVHDHVHPVVHLWVRGVEYHIIINT